MTMPRNPFNPLPPPSTPKEAPWTEIEAIVGGLKDVTDRLNQLITLLTPVGPGGPGSPFPTNVLTAGSLINVFHYGFNQLGVGVYNSNLIEWSKGSRLLIKIESSLDQAVLLQALGDIRDSIGKSAPISVPIVLLAQGKSTIGFGWDDWHPFIWVAVTVAIAPIQGSLDISYRIQS